MTYGYTSDYMSEAYGATARSCVPSPEEMELEGIDERHTCKEAPEAPEAPEVDEDWECPF